MKYKLLISAICTLTFSCANANNPCDGLKLNIVNHTSSILQPTEELSTNSGHYTTPLEKGDSIYPEQTYHGTVSADDLFMGGITGQVNLHSDKYPEEAIRLTFKCVKLFPKMAVFKDPTAQSTAHYSATARLQGSTNIFEIYGP